MRHLVLAACLAFTGSVAHATPARHAKPSKHAKHAANVAPPDDVDAEDADGDDYLVDVVADAPALPLKTRFGRKGDRTVRAHAGARDSERVAFESDAQDDTLDIDGNSEDTIEDTVDVLVTPMKLHKHAKRAKAWQLAVGPYLWASSVEADVSLGPASVGAGIDFIQLQRHARYGAELLAEARHGRFSFSGDLMYGVVDVNGGTTVGPLMVTLDGTASSLLVDGTAGYLVAGNDHSVLSLEARGGVRYQRTSVSGSVGVGGSPIASTEQNNAGADAVAGARVFVRPTNRFYVSSALDLGVFGSSNLTWSASADASVRITSHVMLSLGWRTLTMDRANVSIVMKGPRAALQLTF